MAPSREEVRTAAVVATGVSLLGLVSTTLFPHEWGALTDKAYANVTIGFNERFNVDYKAKESFIHINGADDVVSTITIKCDEYDASGSFKDDCAAVKLCRPIFAGVIILMLAFVTAHSIGNVKIKGISVSPQASASLSALLAFGALFISCYTCHLFYNQHDNIGALNNHGHAYFGLIIFFSLLAFVARAAHLAVMCKDGNEKKYENGAAGPDSRTAAVTELLM